MVTRRAQPDLSMRTFNGQLAPKRVFARVTFDPPHSKNDSRMHFASVIVSKRDGKTVVHLDPEWNSDLHRETEKHAHHLGLPIEGEHAFVLSAKVNWQDRKPSRRALITRGRKNVVLVQRDYGMSRPSESFAARVQDLSDHERLGLQALARAIHQTLGNASEGMTVEYRERTPDGSVIRHQGGRVFDPASDEPVHTFSVPDLVAAFDARFAKKQP